MRYDHELQSAIEAARAAGALLREELHRPDGPRGHGDKAPADAEAEDLIRARLTTAFPAYGFRAEERPGEDRRASDPERHVWIVDPNDGTSSFIKGWRGAAVSIALLRSGVPVLGVVFAYAAPDDVGDLIAWAEGALLTRNGAPVTRPPWAESLEGALVVLAQGADVAEANAYVVAPARFRTMPSIAYRLALVAVGEGDVAVSINAPGSLDYAGGHALLRAVGGTLVNESGAEVTYDATGRSGVSWCFGGAPALVGQLAAREWHEVRRASRVASGLDLAAPQPGSVIREAALLARAQGCLLGQFIGDALGELVEFQGAEAIRRRYPDGVRELKDGGAWDTIAGQPTDDSEMALALARTLGAAGRLDAEQVARAYAWWLGTAPFDLGGTTRCALAPARQALEAGAASVAAIARNAATPASKSNGSVMRVSPLAIFAHALPAAEVAALAREDSALTHPNPVCQDASAVYCVAIAHAIATGAGPRAVYDHAMRFAETAGIHAEVLAALRAAETSPPRSYQQNMGLVTIALQNAFYQLLHAGSAEEGIVDTVSRGGDTDTNGAIAGALLGAVHGRDALPWRWRAKVLSCRPLAGLPGAHRPRPRALWPVDAMLLAELLAVVGRRAA
jgi:ADP-ribosylglycohydrolase/fructose-1,6-bisphosphatase/inositol monophosphatase family enzyme